MKSAVDAPFCPSGLTAPSPPLMRGSVVRAKAGSRRPLSDRDDLEVVEDFFWPPVAAGNRLPLPTRFLHLELPSLSGFAKTSSPPNYSHLRTAILLLGDLPLIRSRSNFISRMKELDLVLSVLLKSFERESWRIIILGVRRGMVAALRLDLLRGRKVE